MAARRNRSARFAPIGYHSTKIHKFPIRERARQPAPNRKVHDERSISIPGRACGNEERLGSTSPEMGKCFGVLIWRGVRWQQRHAETLRGCPDTSPSRGVPGLLLLAIEICKAIGAGQH